MVVAWTEAFDSFTPSSTGWNDYDIYTNKSIPKGAVVQIVCASANDATGVTLGLRADGSSLNRYVPICEAEDGGASVVTMWVKVHSSTGMIEYYASQTTGITFYIMGYFTDLDYVETFVQSVATQTGWVTYTLDGAYSGGYSKVWTVDCATSRTGGNQSCGVRQYGSVLSRYLSIQESEPDYNYHNHVGFTVNIDSSGRCEAYHSYSTSDEKTHITLLGYFVGLIQYLEAITTNVGAGGTVDSWYETYAPAYLLNTGQLVDIVCSHLNTLAEEYCGSRGRYSTIDRKILIKESENSGIVGYTTAVRSDTGRVDVYCPSGTSYDNYPVTGYYYVDGWFEKTITSDAVLKKTSTVGEYGQRTCDNYRYLYSGSATRAGQSLTVSTGKITTIGFYLKRVGSSTTGDVYFRIRKQSDDSIIWEQRYGDAQDISTTTAYYYINPSCVVADESVYALVEFSGGSSTSYCIGLGYVTPYNAVGATVSFITNYTLYTTYDSAYYLTSTILSDTTLVSGGSTTHDIYETSDANLKNLGTSITETSDAQLKGTKALTETSDTKLKGTLFLTETSDSRLKRAYDLTETSDARLKKNWSLTETSDSRLKRAYDLTETSDARLKKNWSLTETSDALLVLSINIKGRYDMETLNGSDLKDLSGYGNDGVPYGGITIGGVTGISGMATDFDGANDYINLGNDGTIANITSNALTLIAWVKPDALGGLISIIDSSVSATSPYAMRINASGQVEITLKLSGTQHTKTFGSAGAIATGVWSMIAFTFDGTNWKCYINKIPQTPQTQAGTIDSSTNDILLGRYP